MLFLDLISVVKGFIDASSKDNGLLPIFSEADIEKLASSEVFIAKFADKVKASFSKDLAFELQKPQSPVRNSLAMLRNLIFLYNEFLLSIQKQAAINEIMNAEMLSAMTLKAEQEEMNARYNEMITRANLINDQELASRIAKLQEQYKDLYLQLNAYANQIKGYEEDIKNELVKIDTELNTLLKINENRLDKISEIATTAMEQDIAVIERARAGLQNVQQELENEVHEAQAQLESLSIDHPDRANIASVVQNKSDEIDKIKQAIKLQDIFIQSEKQALHNIYDRVANVKAQAKSVTSIEDKKALIEEITKATVATTFTVQQSKEKREDLMNNKSDLLKDIARTEKFHSDAISQHFSKGIEAAIAAVSESDKTPERFCVESIKNSEKKISNYNQRIQDTKIKFDETVNARSNLEKEIVKLENNLSEPRRSPNLSSR